MAMDYERYRFTVHEYDQMIEQGIFGDDARIELVEGEIVQMTPIGDRHAEFVNRLTNILRQLLPGKIWISVQNPLRLSALSKPQPDLVLVRLRPGARRVGVPTAPDVLLVVEVADTSLRYDHLVKARLYAQHGIPEYWVLDVNPLPAVLTAYREPSPEGYRSQRTLYAGQPLALEAFPDLAIDTEELLGG